MMPNFRAGLVSILIAAVMLVAGCSRSPEVRKQRFLESGDRYFKAGNYQAASVEYRNAVQIDGLFGAARLGLARSREKVGDLPGAFAEYVRAADLLPDNWDLQLTAGQYLLAARRFDADVLFRSKFANNRIARCALAAPHSK